jgi:hypothetical protein
MFNKPPGIMPQGRRIGAPHAEQPPPIAQGASCMTDPPPRDRAGRLRYAQHLARHILTRGNRK